MLSSVTRNVMVNVMWIKQVSNNGIVHMYSMCWWHSSSGMSDDSQVSSGKNPDEERQRKADKVFSILFTSHLSRSLFISGVQVGWCEGSHSSLAPHPGGCAGCSRQIFHWVWRGQWLNAINMDRIFSQKLSGWSKCVNIFSSCPAEEIKDENHREWLHSLSRVSFIFLSVKAAPITRNVC